MRTLQPGSAPARKPPSRVCAKRPTTLATAALLAGVLLMSAQPLTAGTPFGRGRNPLQATTSPAARQNAIRSIPFDKLDPQAKAKVRSVLSNVSAFRRMPIRVIDCDPDLYLFLTRHPDVVANIWEVLKISRLQLRELDGGTYRLTEPEGTVGRVEFLYSDHDTQVIYGEGTYEGPLFAKPIRGRCLGVLKSGYVRETDGRYYITARLDTFLNVDHDVVDLLTKTFHPLAGKTADVNFIQTMAFLGSLSRTAEVNSRGVQRLASKLDGVRPELRGRLAALAAGIAEHSASVSKRESPEPAGPVAVTAAAGYATVESEDGTTTADE